MTTDPASGSTSDLTNHRPDVVVVGAGLAGLGCALELRSSGLDVLVLEAGDLVGGRVRTDVVDGFRCDRGFQLLNPAYPELRRVVDLDALDLRPFTAGVALPSRSGTAVLADPRRCPQHLLATLRSGCLHPGELARLIGWGWPALAGVRKLRAGTGDTTLACSLDRAGVHGPLRRSVLEPFLSGVLADDQGRDSAAFVRLLLRSFLLATPAVPAAGMAALPEQLAARLPVPVQCGVRVLQVTDGTGAYKVSTSHGTVHARAVVVATDAGAAAELMGTAQPPAKGLVTFWYATDALPKHPKLLRVEPRRLAAGPLVNAAVLSAVAPAYAPPGQHLVQGTALLPSSGDSSSGDSSGTPPEPAVRAHLARLFRCSTSSWQLVTVHEVPHALPRQSVPLRIRQSVHLSDGLFVAGDHRDTSSLQGALVSGRRAAQAVVKWLAQGSSPTVCKHG